MPQSSDTEFGTTIKGLYWRLINPDPRKVKWLTQKSGISVTLATLLLNRNIDTPEKVKAFLSPKLKHTLPDPFMLKDMEKAVQRTIKAINNKEKICVFGDYDVDGATSSAILRRFFREIDIEVDTYIPNRITEGYGPNVISFQKIIDKKTNLIITVDCGSVAFEAIQLAKDSGVDVIVLDHHLGIDKLPEAVAVINPNRMDETFPHKNFAAVGVTFLFLVALKNALTKQNWFVSNKKKSPELMNLLDLVALGTICDVMPLDLINRAIVIQGIKIINRRTNIGIASLSNTIGFESEAKPHHLGFVYGPRINAGGRVGEGILGSDLLATDSSHKAMEIAGILEKLNDERKTIEAQAFEEAVAEIESKSLYEKPMIFIGSKDWHMGILGILASKLKERYAKPVAVMLFYDETAKGSARSIPGLDLGATLAEAKSMGLLLEGGGHAMAGGFAVSMKMKEQFIEFIFNKFQNKNQEFEDAKVFDIDMILPISAINIKIIKDIEVTSPFGRDNPQPKFCIQNAIILSASIVGGEHIMLFIKDGNSDKHYTQKCIIFRGTSSEMGNTLLQGKGKHVDLVGFLQLNHFNPSKVDFVVEDAIIRK